MLDHIKMSKIIEKYRQQAYDLHVNNYAKYIPWRQAILEAIFMPVPKIPGGKGPMTNLHPNIDKLHLPDGVFISDWRKYKVEDHPALMNFQKKCHAAGLHDPFLRNHAWQFYQNTFTHRSRMAFITRGLGFGLVAGFLIVLGETIFFPMTYEHTEEHIKKYGTGERHFHG